MLSLECKRGLDASATRTFRLVGLCSEETDEYHLYLANLAKEDYNAPDITQLYRAHWKVELLFEELKSRLDLDGIKTTDGHIIEALIIMVTISLMMGHIIMNELRPLEAGQGEDETAADADSSTSGLPRRCYSLAVERHGHLIQLYPMIGLGYELPDLGELLLWASRDLSPYRDRLHRQVERGEFGLDCY